MYKSWQNYDRIKLGDSMNTLIINALIIFIVTSATIVVVLNIIQSRKNKKYKNLINNLEIEKNKIDSAPVEPELAKIETYLKNEKMEVMYSGWKERLQNIKEIKIPSITDMLIEAEYSLSQMDYKSTMYKIAKLEMEIYKVRTTSEFLLEEIKDITNSEERSRAVVTKLKTKYRELYQQFVSNKADYGTMAKYVALQFQNIAQSFEVFENTMEKNEYAEVPDIINTIDQLLRHMDVVIEEIPAVFLLAQMVLPKKIKEANEIYKTMTENGYPLDYLNVEYNVEEANKKIADILERTKTLNLEDSVFDLKVLNDYFDSLFTDFEKEKVIRADFEEANGLLKNKLEKMNELVLDIFSQIDDIKNQYNLSKENLDTLMEVKSDLETVNGDYKALQSHVESHNLAFSKLKEETSTVMHKLSAVENKLDSCLDVIGNMHEDEQRAREQLDEIRTILKDAKAQINEYSLPVIPNTYYVELKEANEAISEIIKELSRKPINIETLNTRVDTARDLVLKLFGKTKQMMRMAMLAEMAIVYGNRYRTNGDNLDKKLDYCEDLFLKGDYSKSLELTINSLNKLEPGIYEKLKSYLLEEKED